MSLAARISLFFGLTYLFTLALFSQEGIEISVENKIGLLDAPREASNLKKILAEEARKILYDRYPYWNWAVNAKKPYARLTILLEVDRNLPQDSLIRLQLESDEDPDASGCWEDGLFSKEDWHLFKNYLPQGDGWISSLQKALRTLLKANKLCQRMPSKTIKESLMRIPVCRKVDLPNGPPSKKIFGVLALRWSHSDKGLLSNSLVTIDCRDTDTRSYQIFSQATGVLQKLRQRHEKAPEKAFVEVWLNKMYSISVRAKKEL